MAVAFAECQPKDFQLALNVMLVSVENIAKRNAQTSAVGMGRAMPHNSGAIANPDMMDLYVK